MAKKCEEKECPYYDRTEVSYEGASTAKIMIVGESPGKDEEREGRPFIGRSGVLLNKLLESIKLKRKNILIANSTRCRIDKDNDSLKDISTALKLCRPKLMRVIKQVKPKLIITLGTFSLRQLLHKQKIMENRGRFFKSEEFKIPVFATVHPAFVLRGCTKDYPNKPIEQMTMKEKLLFVDFKTVGEFIKNKYKEVALKTSGYVECKAKDLKEFLKADVIGFDYETSSLNMFLDTTRVISASFSKEKDTAKVFIFGKKAVMPQGMKKILTNKKIDKVVAFRPFDENVSRQKFGIEVKGKIHDVLVMAHLCDENNYRYNLEAVGNVWTTKKNIKDLAEGMRTNLVKASKETIIRYNGVDSDTAREAFFNIRNKMKEDPLLVKYYLKFILPIYDMFSDIYMNGCLIDTDELRASEQTANDLLSNKSKEALKLIPVSIRNKYKDNLKLSRSKLILDYLFLDKKGLRLKPNPYYLTPKTRVPQLSEKHLKQFNRSFIKLYLDCGRISKIQNTYLETLWKNLKPDGRVYPSTTLIRTVTGRTVMLDPAIQTVPQRGEYAHLAKKVFIADKGFEFGSRDLSTSEMRIIGWDAKDPNILKALDEKIDLHVRTAAMFGKVPINKVTKEIRRDGKTGNFGFVYGMSPQGFVTYAKDKFEVIYTLKEAEQMRTKFFSKPNGYYKLPLYYERQKFLAKRDGFVRLILGRKRRLPDAQITSYSKEDNRKRGEAFRQAINARISNFSSDLGLIGMMLFNNEIKGSSLKGNVKPMWFIHDKVFFQARSKYMNRAINILEKCMNERAKEYIYDNFKVDVSYPIESDGEVGTTWNNMKKI